MRRETLVSRDLPDRSDLRVRADIKETAERLDRLDLPAMFRDL